MVRSTCAFQPEHCRSRERCRRCLCPRQTRELAPSPNGPPRNRQMAESCHTDREPRHAGASRTPAVQQEDQARCDPQRLSEPLPTLRRENEHHQPTPTRDERVALSRPHGLVSRCTYPVGRLRCGMGRPSSSPKSSRGGARPPVACLSLWTGCPQAPAIRFEALGPGRASRNLPRGARRPTRC